MHQWLFLKPDLLYYNIQCMLVLITYMISVPCIPPSFLVLSATWLVWPGSWAWRLSHSLCGHTCQKMPWGLQWWRSAFLQGRGPWPRAESFQLTRRKQGKQHKATKKEDTTWIKKISLYCWFDHDNWFVMTQGLHWSVPDGNGYDEQPALVILSFIWRAIHFNMMRLLSRLIDV